MAAPLIILRSVSPSPESLRHRIKLPYHRRKIIIGPNEAKSHRIPPDTSTRHRRCVYSAIPRLCHCITSHKIISESIARARLPNHPRENRRFERSRPSFIGNSRPNPSYFASNILNEEGLILLPPSARTGEMQTRRRGVVASHHSRSQSQLKIETKTNLQFSFFSDQPTARLNLMNTTINRLGKQMPFCLRLSQRF